MSIDGRISLDSTRLPDWTSTEDWKYFQKSLKKMDAVVAGRATYDVAKAHMDKRNSYVLTRSVTEAKKEGSVTFVNPAHTDVAALLSKYKNVGNVGGAEAYQTMLDLGLFDDLYLTIEPIVFGRGQALFTGGAKNHSFTLVSAKKLNKKGTLLLHYKITHA